MTSPPHIASSTTQLESSNHGSNNVTTTLHHKTLRGYHDLQHTVTRRRWLVVGDGDLSYSASIASDLAQNHNIQLIATVLEEQHVHQKIYHHSLQNTATIIHGADNVEKVDPEFRHQVQFGVDATQLLRFFPSTKFDRIVFNFPHWKGKTNAKRNRQLVSDFLKSASQVSTPDADICIALCDNQGGFPATSLAEWRQSWLVPAYAAEHGLLLRRLEPFETRYTQSSHRGVDRPWRKQGNNQLYTFSFPKPTLTVDEALQISCRHELRIVLHPEKLKTSPISRSSIVEGREVLLLAQSFVPDGIDVEVAARDLLTPNECNLDHYSLAVFLIAYSGVTMPLTRHLADEYRSKLESAVQKQWYLDIAKGGRLVSRLYPRQLLPSLIKEYHR